MCLTKIGWFCVEHIYNQISSVPFRSISIFFECVLRAEYRCRAKMCAYLFVTLLERIAIQRLLAVVYSIRIVVCVSFWLRIPYTPDTQFGTQTLRTKEIWHIMKGMTCANQKPKPMPKPKWQTQQNATILIGSGTDDNILSFADKNPNWIDTLAGWAKEQQHTDYDKMWWWCKIEILLYIVWNRCRKVMDLSIQFAHFRCVRMGESVT